MVSKKKVIIGAVVVVAIIAIAAVAVGSSSDDKADARYNFSTQFMNSFERTSGYTNTAPEGTQYLAVKVVVYNDGFDKGITTNDFIWQWTVTTVDGTSYTPSIVGAGYPGAQLAKAEVGGHASTVFVFKIPSNLTTDDITISQKYVMIGQNPNIVLDKTITV